MEHGVLLALVEAVDLVDEEQRPDVVATKAVARACEDRTDVVDPCGDGGELLERRVGRFRDDACDRRLPDARRAVEDHRRRASLVDRAAESRPLAEHLSLADELVERPRADPVRKWGDRVTRASSPRR